MIRIHLARSLLILIAVAQILDVISTNRALLSGAGVEANPLVAAVMAMMGSYWWLWKVALAGFFAYVALTLQEVGLRRLALISALAKIYVVVIVSNFFGGF
jgi:hypothetical protein